MTPERLTWHLENWAEWMSAKVDTGDYSSRAGSGVGKSNSRDFDTMCAECDTVCAKAVGAILDSLPVHLRLAVYNRHLETVWRLRGNLTAIYETARDMVGLGLDRRGIV